MDSGSTLIGIIALALFIVPLFIVYLNSKKTQNKMLQALKDQAQQYNCKISQHEFCGDFVMGIDMKENFVFFAKQNKEDVAFQFIDLSTVQLCQITKKTRTVKTRSENVTVTERVELKFTPDKPDQNETIFELYNDDVRMQLSGELQCADKWSNLINENLNK